MDETARRFSGLFHNCFPDGGTTSAMSGRKAWTVRVKTTKLLQGSRETFGLLSMALSPKEWVYSKPILLTLAFTSCQRLALSSTSTGRIHEHVPGNVHGFTREAIGAKGRNWCLWTLREPTGRFHVTSATLPLHLHSVRREGQEAVRLNPHGVAPTANMTP